MILGSLGGAPLEPLGNPCWAHFGLLFGVAFGTLFFAALAPQRASFSRSFSGPPPGHFFDNASCAGPLSGGPFRPPLGLHFGDFEGPARDVHFGPFWAPFWSPLPRSIWGSIWGPFSRPSRRSGDALWGRLSASFWDPAGTQNGRYLGMLCSFV